MAERRGAAAVRRRDDDLESVARAGRKRRRHAERSRIVLACAEGRTKTRVAKDLGVARLTVTKWRKRFAVLRLPGLLDEPRPGRRCLVTDEQVEAVITKTLEERPADATHWSTRLGSRRWVWTPR
jgi:transposase